MTLVFFGAGASKAFGIPTMSEMVWEFEQKLRVDGSEQLGLYEDIKSILEEGYWDNRIDIEAIFSVVHGIAEGGAPEKLGPYPLYYVRKQTDCLSSLAEKQCDARTLLKNLEDFVKEKCDVHFSNSGIDDVFKRSYDVFFENLRGLRPQTNRRSNMVPGGWCCITTNYDLVFENYWGSNFVTLDDFFDKSGELTRLESSEQGPNCLVKLHGSINWNRLEGGIIKKSNQESEFSRVENRGAAMLYPISQKDMTRHPWDALFRHFKSLLRMCSYWYIVGSALNDHFVLNAMLEVLETGHPKKITIIDPHASKLKEKFKGANKNYIKTLPTKFGSTYFPDDFADFAEDQRTLDIELSSLSDCFGIAMPNHSIRGEITGYNDDSKHHYLGSNGHPHLIFGSTPQQDKQKQLKFPTESPPTVHAKSTVKFRVCVTGVLPCDGIDFELMTQDGKRVHVSVFNQKRLIHESDVGTFPRTRDAGDSGVMDFSERIHVPIEKLWPVE